MPSPKTKLTFRLWKKVYDVALKRMTRLSRDAIFDDLLRIELDKIDAEIPVANSELVRAHIETHLKLALKGEGGKQVSMLLSTDMATKLADVCARKNIPRESLLNRLFILFVAKPSFIAANFFNAEQKDLQKLAAVVIKKFADGNPEEEALFSPLKTLESVLDNPFWGYHELVAEYFVDDNPRPTLHTRSWQADEMIGFNCCYPEEDVPGTAAYRERQAFWKSLESSVDSGQGGAI